MNIAVIGAGPAGNYAASLLAKQGHDVNVFEEHKVIGAPIQCTGIMSKNLTKYIPKEDLEKFTFNKAKGAHFYSKNEHAELRTDKVQAYILCRTKHDQYFAKLAEDSGAKLNLQHHFVKFEENKEGSTKYAVNFKTHEGARSYNADIIIGADGPRSSVAKQAGLFEKRKFWHGIQYTAQGSYDKEMIDMYLGSVCPGFFAWVVPESETSARIGLGCTENAKKHFDKFVESYKDKMKKESGAELKITGVQSGLIPVYEKTKTEKDGIYLVGDAALQVKATTGGGVVMNLGAGEALAEAISTGKSYQKLWENRIGKDLFYTKLIRNKLNKFNDNDYDSIVRILRKPRVMNFIKERGDMDYPSRFIGGILMRAPQLIKYGIK